MGKTFGYLRVSTIDQNNNKFEAEILKFANERDLGKVEFIDEKISGTKDWRKRKLGELITLCSNGDVIIVPELSRLSRSISQIYEIITEFQKKGCTLYVLKQNMTISNKNDLTTKVMLSTFALVADLEREFISIRTKEALQSKKLNGVKLGRPKTKMGKCKLDQYASEVIALYKTGSSFRWIADRYGVADATVSVWIKRHCPKGRRG